MITPNGDVVVPHEVVIVRRRASNEDEGHHGGAWKIAFADLMTAMMTFFLVMWLINISDKQKIENLAAYFNPTKLNQKQKTVKGVEEVPEANYTKSGETKEKVSTVEDDSKEHKNKAENHTGDGKEVEGDPKKAEEELFNDPYGILARMALKVVVRGEDSNGGTLSGAEALPGGEAYRSPFEPQTSDFPMQKSPKMAAGQQGEAEVEVPGVTPSGKEGSATGARDALSTAPDARSAEAEKQATAQPAVNPQTPAAAAHETNAPEVKASEAKAPDAAAKEKTERDAVATAEAAKLESEIKKSLTMLAAEDKPSISVKRVDEGVLISLTDDFRFGMFALSSAEPKPEVVVVMEKVGKALAARPGMVVIRGHTDGRQFKSQKNDNWRLSMSRAQVAYYMLMRGGLQETRVESIEGHADRSLAVPIDPNAAQNRRIEILLRDPAS